MGSDRLKRALIFGGSGLVGGKIASVLPEAGYTVDYTYFRNKIDIAHSYGHYLDMIDQQKIKDLIDEIKPDLIVNAASLPSVDWCDKNPERAFKINSEPQRIVAEYAKTGACIVYISTSNVFGFSKKPLTESDEPEPISTYGKTKLLGERYTAKLKRHIILRSDQIYGWTEPKQKKTFVERSLEKFERGEIVEVCADWYNCPTYANDIALAFQKLIVGNHTGLFHAVGPTYLNRYEWATKIAEVFGYSKDLVEAINSTSLNLPAKRSNCALNNSKIEKLSGIRFLSVDEALLKMKASRNIRHP